MFLKTSASKHFFLIAVYNQVYQVVLDLFISVAEPKPGPELQGAASFGRSRSRTAMRLRLRQLRQWYLSWLGI
jgi:hypothetical protein